ncbi:hypothetical protein NIES4074_55680 [Cylindrospermum sp. NIES-4074]|nr:hypothetical protein NIES4074_55680 [Cylindrospermum sp. NIES-4074]
MYRFKFPLLGCFLTASSIFTTFAPAKALDFSFSFTSFNQEVQQVGEFTFIPGTVTGRILDLADNTVDQAASKVIIDTYPGDIGVPGPGLVATAWGIPGRNVFSVSSGNITKAIFSVSSSESSIFCFGSGTKSNCGTDDNSLTANFITGKFVSNGGGFSGITFTNLDATPVPFSFADGSVAITFLGSFWGLNKLRQAISKKKALLPQ